MTEERRAGALLAIAIFKLLKAALLVALGVAAMLLARDSDAFVTLHRFAASLKFGPDDQLIERALSTISGLGARRLEALGVGTFAYAAVFTVEGVGLLRRKRWAEYLTTLVTASFMPFEVYELVHRASWLKAGGLALNALIVAYLAWRLFSRR